MNAEIRASSQAWFRRDPADIATRNLLYGSGAPEHAPHGTFVFEKEDLADSSPKFTVSELILRPTSLDS